MSVKVGDRVRVESPASAFHDATGQVGEIRGHEVYVSLDDQSAVILSTSETGGMTPFFPKELRVVEDDNEQEPPVECWVIVDREDRFYRKKLPTQPRCYVTVFSTEELAAAYMELIQPGFAGVRLETKHYTWGGIIERFSPQMTHVLLDHEHGSDEGVAVPI